MDCDEKFMRRALELAHLAWGKTHPNPMVGAVIVKGGKIIAEGYHKKDGDLHAERNAINSLTQSPEGATIYVSLEPCSTKGRTGACTDAIIASGIKKVVIGTLDPNPAHAGKAIGILENAGIECKVGVLEKECRDLNIIFNHFITEKNALLAIKYAQTKNGKIAEKRGVPSQITSEVARAHLMHYRALFPAIAVGFGTLLADNPSLTVRDESGESSNARFILDRNLNCAKLNLSNYKVFSDKFKDLTTVVCDLGAPIENLEFLKSKGVKTLQIKTRREEEKLFWQNLKVDIKLPAIMVEGGAKILTSIARCNAADYAFKYIAEKVFENTDALDAFDCPAPEIKNPVLEKLPPDICIRGFLQ